MLRKALLGLSLLGLILVTRAVHAADATTSAIEWIPDQAVVTLEVSQPQVLFDTALDPKYLTAVQGIPGIKQASGKYDIQRLQMIVEHLCSQLGTDWKTALPKLTGGGVTAALGPHGEAVVIVEAADPAMLNKLHEILLGIAKEKNGDKVQSSEYQNATAWTFGPNESHTIVGNRLVFSNRSEALRAVLDLRAGQGGTSVASTSEYRAARQAVGTGAAAMLYVHVGQVKEAPALQKLFSQPKNPMGTLLLGDLALSLRDADWLAAGLKVSAGTLTLRVATDTKSSADGGPWAFAKPASGSGALPNLVVQRQIAAGSVYRDLHAFYGAKDQLFPDRTSALIFFENMMGIFFSGRDLTEEVLVEAYPEIRFVFAAQQYQGSAAPKVQLPAFGIVFRSHHPEKFGEMVEEAWQKAVGIVNTTRGQKGQPGLVFDRDIYSGVKYSHASFSKGKEDEKDKLGMRFNFQPALIRVDDYIVFTSTDDLAKELIDILKKEKAQSPRPLAGVHTQLKVDCTQLASVLQANRDVLVNRNMVEQGHSAEQAGTGVALFTALIERLGTIRVELGHQADGTQATLEIKPNVK